MLGKPEKKAPQVPGKPEKKHHRYLVDLYTKTTGALQTCTTHMEGGGAQGFWL